jgi:hypothetical protein
MESTKTPASKQPILVLLAGTAANLRKKKLPDYNFRQQAFVPKANAERVGTQCGIALVL